MSSPSNVSNLKPVKGIEKRAKNANVEFYGDLATIDWNSIPSQNECHPGQRPIEYNVIIALSEMPEKIGSIIIPEAERDRMELAIQYGRLIRMSPHAFNYEKWPDETLRPKVGDLVWVARYAGGLFGGKDGRAYRIVKDKDIGGVIEEDGQ